MNGYWTIEIIYAELDLNIEGTFGSFEDCLYVLQKYNNFVGVDIQFHPFDDINKK